MQKLTNSVRNFLVEEEGASLVEYALLVALIAVVAIIAVRSLGSSASNKLNQAALNLS